MTHGGDRATSSAQFAAGDAPRARGRARRRRARGRERDALHAVPLARRSTRARTTTAARSRTAPASRSRSSARSAPRSATTSASASRSASTRLRASSCPGCGRATASRTSSRCAGWLEEAGVDYLHVSAGTGFPHPRNPAGRFPATDVVQDLRHADLERAATRSGTSSSSSTWPLSAVFRWWWERPRRRLGIEGINLAGSRAVKQSVSIPVLCTGGFQTASVIAGAIERGDCDGVTIARPLVANPDLVRLLRAGPRPRAAAVHVLQQVPLQLRREPARLLRGGALRLAGGDGRRDLLRLRAGRRRGEAGGGGRMTPRRHLRAAPVPHPRGQEPRLPLEPRRPLQQLRRHGHPDPRQLGPQVRAGRGRRRSSRRTRPSTRAA